MQRTASNRGLLRLSDVVVVLSLRDGAILLCSQPRWLESSIFRRLGRFSLPMQRTANNRGLLRLSDIVVVVTSSSRRRTCASNVGHCEITRYLENW